MDIVLEVSDYFLFDALYASVLPKDGSVAEFFKKNTGASNNLNSSIAYTSNYGSQLSAVTSFFDSIRNKDEIYGLAPNLLPASKHMNDSFLPRSSTIREFITMFIITTIFGWVLYLGVATFSYFFMFDKKIFNHPRYLKNQIWLEIHRGITAIPTMVSLTIPFFLLELNGFSKLYMKVDESTGGWKAILIQIPQFILFTDCGIYFIHRWLHWPSVYKRLHKPHHKWIVCTPFASHAFHPVDGWAQSLPYHLYPLFFSLNKLSYLGLFTFVNFWTVMIHDGQYLSNDPVVNGTANHTIHHLYFNYNYGQFTTLWDRLGGSYRRPDDSLFDKESDNKKTKKMWKEQVGEMEVIRNELEGKGDDREYIDEKN
jgi:lathosterol oxidase